jgi:hypothetical protein
MIENQSPEVVHKNAQRIAESLRAAIYYMTDLVIGHNEEGRGEPVNVETVLRETTQVKFVKPTNAMINTMMKQYDVLLVQVIPVNPTSVLAHILEQGYHVVPTAHLDSWKRIIRSAQADTVELIITRMREEEAEENDADDSDDNDTADSNANPGEEV